MSEKHVSVHKGHENCCSCISRRKCVGLLSAAALGLTMGSPGLAIAASSRRKMQKIPPDYIDVTKLRPHPKMRIVYAVLEQPRPYWLGWAGTNYVLAAAPK